MDLEPLTPPRKTTTGTALTWGVIVLIGLALAFAIIALATGSGCGDGSAVAHPVDPEPSACTCPADACSCSASSCACPMESCGCSVEACGCPEGSCMCPGIRVSVPVPITPDDGWTAAHGLSYWIDAVGMVRLHGAVRATSSDISVIAFTLPEGSRPSAPRLFPALCLDAGAEEFRPSAVAVYEYGAVIMDPPAAGRLYSLDGVSFLAEQ